MLECVLQKEIVIKVEPKKDSQSQHYDGREDPKFRMKDSQIYDKQLYQHDHDCHNKMHQSFVLDYGYLFSVKLNDLIGYRPAAYISRNLLFVIPAILLYIDPKSVLHTQFLLIHILDFTRTS